MESWIFNTEQILNQFVHQTALDRQIMKLVTQSATIDPESWNRIILDGNDRNSAQDLNFIG